MVNRPSDNALTIEQCAAARHPARLLSIEAGPGTGKTRVAAHRFGLLRFDSRDLREVVALSFTRSAAAELRDRIQSLWGSAAVIWPHNVGTIDDYYRRLVGHLLAEKVILLPGRQTALEVRDAWTAEDGWSKTAGEWAFDLRKNEIVVDRIVAAEAEGFVSEQAARVQLEEAQCTHGDVRLFLTRALEDEFLRLHLTRYLRDCVKAVLIDEIYDGNDTEAQVMALFALAGLHLTVIGDSRQVLYEFRGADPKRIERAAVELKMTRLPLNRSHRFGSAVRPVADALNHRQPLDIEKLEEHDRRRVDVVLSSEWRRLWKVGEDVMPLRRGKVVTVADAALHMLIDACAARGTGLRGASIVDAERILGGPSAGASPDFDAERLGGLLEDIGRDLTRGDAAQLLAQAAEFIAPGGRHRPATIETMLTSDHVKCLNDLADRWKKGPGSLVPALSIHQAKGREWDQVGLCVTELELEQLRQGLPRLPDDARHRRMMQCHRRLYVGMTRARELIILVTAQARGEGCWYGVTARQTCER